MSIMAKIFVTLKPVILRKGTLKTIPEVIKLVAPFLLNGAHYELQFIYNCHRYKHKKFYENIFIGLKVMELFPK